MSTVSLSDEHLLVSAAFQDAEGRAAVELSEAVLALPRVIEAFVVPRGDGVPYDSVRIVYEGRAPLSDYDYNALYRAIASLGTEKRS